MENIELTRVNEAFGIKENKSTSVATKKANTKFNNPFSKEVFELTYQFGNDEDINDRHFNVAADIASVEKAHQRDYWHERFVQLLADFKFVPGGRITSNAGTGLKSTTYINCFVSGFRGKDQDSMKSIMEELQRQAMILKSEGGYGFCADVMRPRGAFVEGIGGDSPGAVKLLEMWDTQSAVITAGSGKDIKREKGKKKIRKGAQMVTMSVFHPDIVEFIEAKQTPNRLTKFNMSVLISDDFMKAVKNSKEWLLEFPDFETAKEAYSELWDGDLAVWKQKGLPTKVYHRFENANELWDLIMSSTYKRNEPGVLFVDTINRMNNLYYAEKINATNPCGEQVLPVGGSCLLGSLNLTQFVDIEQGTWDYKKLAEYVPLAVRFLDNVNDRTKVPLPEQEKNLIEKRRIGLGIMGYASALMMIKVRYGSSKALGLTEALSRFIMNEAYRASAMLAKEKGSFGIFDKDKYLQGEFVKTLDPEVKDLISKYGIRNSHLLSIQPTGNSSVLANNVSGGLEPVFMTSYIRTSQMSIKPKGLFVPEKIDWQSLQVLDESSLVENWKWSKEGDDDILLTEHDGDIYKIDQGRGLLRENRIKDYAFEFLEKAGIWQEGADYTATAYDLKIKDHIETMKVFSRYIDSAMSKTVNIPNDYPFEDFKSLYQDVFETGTIKGCTSYRDGTMLSVLSVNDSSSKISQRGIPRTKAMPRPQGLACDIHHLTVNAEKWVVLVGLLDSDPYEVFAMKQDRLVLPTHLVGGHLHKMGNGHYNLETGDGWILENISEFFESSEQEALTRMISTALRHGTDIGFIVSQLFKSVGTINSYSKAIARTLKVYISDLQAFSCSDCGSANIKIAESCFVCLDCGSSKCE